MLSGANLFILRNSQGMTTKLMNYGATLVSLKITTSSGEEIELTLGFDTLEEYLAHPFYFGCTVGRVANRIAAGSFSYQNKRYQLNCNENAFSHLHGGAKSFDKVFWQGRQYQEKNGSGVVFSYLSKDGEENYPGNLLVEVNYFLSDENTLKITYTAETDQATPVNLTNHTYWNLAGSGNILQHEMQVFSDEYLETNKYHIPTGEIKSVAGTAFDFRTRETIGKRIEEAGGYDNFYVLVNTNRLAARVTDPVSQRTLETYTTQPGLQFYSGNYLADYAIAEGKRTERWGGFCLETQGFPDAVNHENFPSIILQPEDTYHHETIYKIKI